MIIAPMSAQNTIHGECDHPANKVKAIETQINPEKMDHLLNHSSITRVYQKERNVPTCKKHKKYQANK